ncbi:MAG: hypothetical protein V6Z89_15230 [Desulfobacter sp.]
MFSVKRLIIGLVSVVPFGITVPALATVEYDSLISSTMFDGIRADVNTTATGIITILLIIVGLAMIARAFTR